MNDLSSQTPREPEWYISICPETGRRFLCETGRDDNIAELFATKREEDLITGSKAMFAALQKAVAALNTAPRFRIPSLDTDSYEIAAICDRAIAKARGE